MSKADKQRIPDYIEHIITAISRIFHYTNNMDRSDFHENELVQDAVIRNIEIMGEALGILIAIILILQLSIPQFHGKIFT